MGQGGVSAGSMQGEGRGEEERGEVSEKGSGEERKRKQRAGGGKRDGGRGEGEGMREEESGEWEGRKTKSFISCKVTTAVSATPRLTYVTEKRLRAQQSAHSFGNLCYCLCE